MTKELIKEMEEEMVHREEVDLTAMVTEMTEVIEVTEEIEAIKALRGDIMIENQS